MDMAVMDIIEKRRSVRTYETTPIGADVHASVMEYLQQEDNRRGPFGGTCGIEWVWAKGEAMTGRPSSLVPMASSRIRRPIWREWSAMTRRRCWSSVIFFIS